MGQRGATGRPVPPAGDGPQSLSGRGNREPPALPPGFGTIWTAVAIDLVGFGIVLPILPLYAKRFHTTSLRGHPAGCRLLGGQPRVLSAVGPGLGPVRAQAGAAGVVGGDRRRQSRHGSGRRPGRAAGGPDRRRGVRRQRVRGPGGRRRPGRTGGPGPAVRPAGRGLRRRVRGRPGPGLAGGPRRTPAALFPGGWNRDRQHRGRARRRCPKPTRSRPRPRRSGLDSVRAVAPMLVVAFWPWWPSAASRPPSPSSGRGTWVWGSPPRPRSSRRWGR